MKHLLGTTALLIIAVASFAQQGPYFRAGGGYAFTAGGRLSFGPVPLQGTALGRADGTQENSLRRKSLGEGWSISGAAGYRFRKLLAAELGVYALAGPAEHRYVRSYDYLPDVHIDESRARNAVYLMPAIVLHSDTKLDGFARLGAVLPVSGYTEYVHSQTVPSGSTGGGHNGHVSNTTSVSTHHVTHRFSPGFTAAIGASYPVWKGLSVAVEGSFISLGQWGRRQERVAFTENGEDALGRLTVSQKKSELTYQPVYGTPGSEPLQEPAYSIPYSSLGLTLSLCYRL